MADYCFLITDKQHKVYYASDKASLYFGKPVEQLHNTPWLEQITTTHKSLIKDIILHDIQQDAYFNGFIHLDYEQLLFCDYGKRYDADGNHIGYELMLNPAPDSAAEYMNHFYQSISDKCTEQKSNPVAIYREEKVQIEHNVGSDFNEFLIALQADDE